MEGGQNIEKEAEAQQFRLLEQWLGCTDPAQAELWNSGIFTEYQAKAISKGWRYKRYIKAALNFDPLITADEMREYANWLVAEIIPDRIKPEEKAPKSFEDMESFHHYMRRSVRGICDIIDKMCGFKRPPSPLLRIKSIKKEAPNLIVKLKNESDPVSAYLKAQFNDEAQRLIGDYDVSSKPSRELLKKMVDELNRLLKISCFIREDVFHDFLSEAERELKLRNQIPIWTRPTSLNRSLLERAYRKEIVPRFSAPEPEPIELALPDPSITIQKRQIALRLFTLFKQVISTRPILTDFYQKVAGYYLNLIALPGEEVNKGDLAVAVIDEFLEAKGKFDKVRDLIGYKEKPATFTSYMGRVRTLWRKFCAGDGKLLYEQYKELG